MDDAKCDALLAMAQKYVSTSLGRATACNAHVSVGMHVCVFVCVYVHVHVCTIIIVANCCLGVYFLHEVYMYVRSQR